MMSDSKKGESIITTGADKLTWNSNIAKAKTANMQPKVESVSTIVSIHRHGQDKYKRCRDAARKTRESMD